jgi:hypothetical protein
MPSFELLDFLGFPWISWDFLGFSRPNRDFSMVTRDKSGKFFLGAFASGVGVVTTGGYGLDMQKGEVGHIGELSPISDFPQQFVGSYSVSC